MINNLCKECVNHIEKINIMNFKDRLQYCKIYQEKLENIDNNIRDCKYFELW